MRERKEGKGEGWCGIVGKEKFLCDKLWRRLKKYLRTQLLVYIIDIIDIIDKLLIEGDEERERERERERAHENN